MSAFASTGKGMREGMVASLGLKAVSVLGNLSGLEDMFQNSLMIEYSVSFQAWFRYVVITALL